MITSNLSTITDTNSEDVSTMEKYQQDKSDCQVRALRKSVATWHDLLRVKWDVDDGQHSWRWRWWWSWRLMTATGTHETRSLCTSIVSGKQSGLRAAMRLTGGGGTVLKQPWPWLTLTLKAPPPPPYPPHLTGLRHEQHRIDWCARSPPTSMDRAASTDPCLGAGRGCGCGPWWLCGCGSWTQFYYWVKCRHAVVLEAEKVGKLGHFEQKVWR